ncbi:hypothetical protein COCOBI_03-5880 [Coccomyxa sp. Obi]|nr:hypothetical protein COCOBI_03-5880 [Coccomyxa sp. Obi]
MAYVLVLSARVVKSSKINRSGTSRNARSTSQIAIQLSSLGRLSIYSKGVVCEEIDRVEKESSRFACFLKGIEKRGVGAPFLSVHRVPCKAGCPLMYAQSCGQAASQLCGWREIL